MFHKEDLKVVHKIFTKNFQENYIVYFSGLNMPTDTKSMPKNANKRHKPERTYFECRVSNKHTVVINREENILKEELIVRNNIRCSFLVNVISTFQDITFLYYVTELPRGGFLYFYLHKCGNFDLDVAQFLFSEILLAIQYLHARNLVYRLLIPENIMVTADGHIKLKFDFLNSFGLTESQFQQVIEYIPVDYLTSGESTFVSDYWSLGVILFEMIAGISPFKGNSFEQTKFNIINSNPVYNQNFDKKSKDLIRRLLDKDKTQRLGFYKKDRFRIRIHPFLKNMDFLKLSENNIKSPLNVVIDTLFNKESDTSLGDIYKKEKRYVSSDGYGNIFKFYGSNSDLFNQKRCSLMDCFEG